MTQIEVYGLKTSFAKHTDSLSMAIHSTVVESLANKFHRFIGLVLGGIN
jgi:hypothetical protein